MFCPNCSQEQLSTATKFCSRCGFLMTGVIELVENGGEVADKSFMDKLSGDSPRKRGVKQGVFIFLLSFLIVPIIAILTIASRSEPFVVAIAAILLGVGGLLRMIYALLLQSNEMNGAEKKIDLQKLLRVKSNEKSLPAASTAPVSSFVPPINANWRDTNDLIPSSVTEETTNLLNKELMNETEAK